MIKKNDNFLHEIYFNLKSSWYGDIWIPILKSKFLIIVFGQLLKKKNEMIQSRYHIWYNQKKMILSYLCASSTILASSSHTKVLAMKDKKDKWCIKPIFYVFHIQSLFCYKFETTLLQGGRLNVIG